MDLKKTRQLAGLPTDASPEHIKNEKALFKTACESLSRITAMAKARLKHKTLTAEHKAQYEKMVKEVDDCCEIMKAHLDTYNK